MNRLCAALILLASFTPLRAEFPKPKSEQTTTPFGPVRVTRYEFEQPRPLKAWAVRIDLTDPDVELVVTPRVKVDKPNTVLSETTLAFAEANMVQLAINGSPFTPLRAKPGEPMKINGLNLSRGDLISPPGESPRNAGLLIDGANRVSIRAYPIPKEELAKARNGLGGFSVVIRAGNNLLARSQSENPPRHPRTAVGLSDKGRYLWWLVIDGRQPGVSEGVTYAELGDWGVALGLTDLLNLDGGGSTTLVQQDPATGKYAVVNRPVGKGPPGTLRQNGNGLGLRVYSGPNDLTSAQLRAVMPRLTAERATLFLGPLNRALAEYGINTPGRRAAFLAQLAHESGELKYMEEIASGEAYEGRKSLGNTEPGDGKRYKGRGPIQLTGRSNYRRAGAALGLDLEGEPTKVTDPEVGCRVAGWFWKTRGLNELADAGDFRQITKRVNGGYNGLEKREAYYKKAKAALGVK